MTISFQHDDGGRSEAGYKGETGDCVIRSISIATQKSYQEVYNALYMIRDSLRQTKRIRRCSSRNGISRPIYDKYLKSLGWKWIPTMGIGSGCKVHLKSDELPRGKLIVRVSKHLAAVVDGVLRDNHDCSRGGTRCVYGYYVKDSMSTEAQ